MLEKLAAKMVQAQTCGLNREIEILQAGGQLVVSSRQIAENFKKNHRDVLESIDQLAKGVAEKSADLFIPSEYTHEQNKQIYREYLLTRDGFSLLVMGFTGSRALEWKLKYIEAFNKMENKLKNPFESLSPELQSIFMLDKKTQHLEGRVDHLEDTMVIDYSQQEFLNSHARARVLMALGGKESNAYKKVSKVIFKELWGDYKTYFQINSYKNTPKAKYLEAIEYLANWEPSNNNKLEILHLNSL